MMDPSHYLAECDFASPLSSFTASFAADAAKVPGAIGALGTTSSSVISFVSPSANVMRIAVSSSDE